MAELKIKIIGDIERVTQQVQRMHDYFTGAPDDDPVKRAMADFGEIEVERDIVWSSEFLDGALVMRCALGPDLQRLHDMLPA